MIEAVIERKITYYTRKRTKKVDPWLHIGLEHHLKDLGIELKHHVYCMKLQKDQIVLEPAKNQKNPRDNSCFRAILVKLKINNKIVYRMRLAYFFLKKVGTPKKVTVKFVDNNIILVPSPANKTS